MSKKEYLVFGKDYTKTPPAKEVVNEFAYGYSPNEIKLIEHFNLQDVAKSLSMNPVELYSLMASIAVTNHDYSKYTDAVGRALKELKKLDKMNRLTDEWENLISVN